MRFKVNWSLLAWASEKRTSNRLNWALCDIQNVEINTGNSIMRLRLTLCAAYIRSRCNFQCLHSKTVATIVPRTPVSYMHNTLTKGATSERLTLKNNDFRKDNESNLKKKKERVLIGNSFQYVHLSFWLIYRRNVYRIIEKLIWPPAVLGGHV